MKKASFGADGPRCRLRDFGHRHLALREAPDRLEAEHETGAVLVAAVETGGGFSAKRGGELGR